MSMSPHQIFGRLQELKKWQQTHENILRRSNVDEHFEKSSLHRSYSPTNPNNITENLSRNSKPNINLEFENNSLMKIKGTQGKNFEQILEEKLKEYAENSTSQTQMKNIRTKKPFLKKGAGLMKYNLKPEEYKKMIGNKFSNTIDQHKPRPKSVQNRKKPISNLPERPKISGQERQPNLTSKSLNCMRPLNKTSKDTFQRSKPTISVSSKKVEPLKVSIKNNENSIVNKPIHCGMKNSVHAKEALKSVIDPIQELIIAETDRASPKLKEFVETISMNTENVSTFTPLKAPDISIKPKGSWCGTAFTKLDNDIPQRGQWVDSFQHSDINKLREKFAFQSLIQTEWTNGTVNQMLQIDSSKKVENDLEEDNLHIKAGARKSLSYTPKASEQNLYEKALETELMIFEALERRSEQSGFCSTNTSIIQLLASSPSRFNFKNSAGDGNCPVFERIIDSNEDIDDKPVRDENITLTPSSDRFETASEESDPPKYFRKRASSATFWPAEGFSHFPRQVINQALSESDTETEEGNHDIQVQNEIKNRRVSSVNTDNISLKCSNYSSEQSDSSEEYSEQPLKTCKNPKSPDRSPKISESCSHCGFLIEKKIRECESELNSLKLEKNKVVEMRKQMASDQKEFEKEMEISKKEFEQQKRQYELQLEEEKKKILEKTTGEMPRKDIKSKLQQRKDREEINDLKIELSEIKELMKLRETKNAMSIARLRNQVKLLEKNNAELKAENEKLLKEKSKLVAQQKTYNKSTETKMLREISKNISKLTEDKFKNQNIKNDSSSEELIQNGCRGDSEVKSKRSSTGLKKTVAFSCHGHGEGPLEEHKAQPIVSNNDIQDECIEEKYKSLFGGQDVIIENRSNNQKILVENIQHTGISKSEKNLDDGTKEIKYSNGNMKLISENGTVRYYYASNDIWHTNFVDGTEVLEFPNGQSEKRFKDGKCLIFFPDGLVQTIFPNGTEEVKYPDGSKLVTKNDGERMLFLSNGQVEIHTKDQKRREYPDGTVKILYPDGSQETRYSNGRIRVKNNEGDIILDTGAQNS